MNVFLAAAELYLRSLEMDDLPLFQSWCKVGRIAIRPYTHTHPGLPRPPSDRPHLLVSMPPQRLLAQQ